MVKTIHLIKVGFTRLGDHELACIDSWKRVYPDFEIKFWGNKECWDMIQDCKYAYDAFNDGKPVFALDYMRLKILYEEGGLYMDTDVFALNRIPDEYFNKAWLTWDDRFESCWTNNGTGCYSEPRNPIFKEFMEVYQNIKYDRDNTYSCDALDFVLEKHGMDKSDKVGTSLRDQDLDLIKIVNRVQFGANDYLMFRFMQDEREQYLLHGQVGSWTNGISERASLFYFILDSNTTYEYAKSLVEDFISLKYNKGSNLNYNLSIFVDGVENLDKANELGMRLNWYCPKESNSNRYWAIYPIGNNIGRERMSRIIPDFLIKKFHKMYYARNIGSPIGKIQDWEKE